MIRHGKHSSPKTKAVSKKKPPLFLGNVPIQGALHIFYIIYPTHIIYNVNKALETFFSAISIVIFMIREKKTKNICTNTCTNKKNFVPLHTQSRNKGIRALSSVGSERLPYKQRVGGSNPSAPTKKAKHLRLCFLLFIGSNAQSSPSSRLISCNSVRMDCRRPMICEVSLAALWFLVRTAFAAAIFMPRTLSRL